MKSVSSLSLLFIFLFSAAALAVPAQVALIRHAEKPEEGNELNERGWQRAGALPELFRNRTELNDFGLPAALYAMDPKDDSGSVRSIQTLQYLSRFLNLPIRSAFKKKQHAQMVHEIMTNPALDGNRVWLISNLQTSQLRMQSLPQRILPGDSAN